MYFSKITPAGFSQAQPVESIKAEPVRPEIQEEANESGKHKGKSLLTRAFTSAVKAIVKTAFHPYLVLPVAIYAGGVRAYVATEQYVEAKYGARNDWSLPGSCTVMNAATGKEYSFTTQRGRNIPKGTKAVSSPRQAFLECKNVMNSDGFKFGRLDITYDLYIDQIRGFNGEINGSMGGKSSSYNSDQAAEAKELIEDLPYYALKREMQLIGKANTPDWYLYEALTIQRDFNDWLSTQWESTKNNVNAQWSNAIDGGISGLEKLKPSSPSSQGIGSETSLAPQVQ